MDNKLTKDFEKTVEKTIKDYKLIDKKHKVLVALSGGKDSMSLLYILKNLGYNVEALMIDLETGEHFLKNKENAEAFCRKLEINFHICSLHEEFEMKMLDIWKSIQKKEKLTNCMICGVIKKWMLNKKAKELGFDKMATGHNLDDAAETILMNLFSGNPFLGINEGPMTGIISDKAFVQRIKPLYFCSNEEVRKYSEEKGFKILYKPCPFLTKSSRKGIREGLESLEKEEPEVKRKLVYNFLKRIEPMKREYNNMESVKQCKICGEATRTDLCKKCRIMELLK